MDGDIAIELDLSVPSMRPLYFLYDISSMLETVLIRRLLLPGDVFVDVGANIGYFSLIAAKYARQVVAFEPSPMTRPYLRRNLELNPALASRVTVHSLALSDHCGSAEMFNPPDYPGMAALRPTGQEREVVESVALDTMDHALVDQRVSFIKVDVEGGELDVLNGACLTIDRGAPSSSLSLSSDTRRASGTRARTSSVSSANATTKAIACRKTRPAEDRYSWPPSTSPI